MSDKEKGFIETRSPEQITIDKILAERERFDLDSWKLRSPHENVCAKMCYVSDEQTMFRKNLDTLTTLRKSFVGDSKNATLQSTVDDAITKFVNALVVTDITKAILSEIVVQSTETAE
jgi:hypothetical protein